MESGKQKEQVSSRLFETTLKKYSFFKTSAQEETRKKEKKYIKQKKKIKQRVEKRYIIEKTR